MLNIEIDQLNEEISQCIDRSFDIFGPAMKHFVFHELTRKTGIQTFMIPDQPGKFIAEIKKMFGSGSLAIEKQLNHQLGEKFHLDIGIEDRFVDVIAMVREKRARDSDVRISSAGSVNPWTR